MARKKTKYLVIHCTATQEGREITSAWIKKLHMGKNGWSRVGYTDMIHLNGSLELLHFAEGSNPFDGYTSAKEMTWGVKGQNSHSKHIVYVGGVEAEKREGKYQAKDTRTSSQNLSLEIYVRHEILRDPKILIAGHNQFSSKACPSFNVAKWCRSIGIQEKNIYQAPGLYERAGDPEDPKKKNQVDQPEDPDLNKSNLKSMLWKLLQLIFGK